MNATYPRFEHTPERIRLDWMNLGDALTSAAIPAERMPGVSDELDRLASLCFAAAYGDDGGDNDEPTRTPHNDTRVDTAR